MWSEFVLSSLLHISMFSWLSCDIAQIFTKIVYEGGNIEMLRWVCGRGILLQVLYGCMVVPIQLWEHKLSNGTFIKFLFDILYPKMLYCCLNIAVYCQRRCLKELKETCWEFLKRTGPFCTGLRSYLWMSLDQKKGGSRSKSCLWSNWISQLLFKQDKSPGWLLLI